MNALEQLKELRDDRETPGMAEAWQMDAAQYIRDHGPALVELIDAADRIVTRHLRGTLDYGDVSTMIPSLVKLTKAEDSGNG